MYRISYKSRKVDTIIILNHVSNNIKYANYSYEQNTTVAAAAAAAARTGPARRRLGQLGRRCRPCRRCCRYCLILFICQVLTSPRFRAVDAARKRGAGQ